MADAATDQENSVAYISGVDSTGAVAANSYSNWNNDTPATYTATQGYVQRWYNDANGVQIAPTVSAGTGGGTVTYTFGAGVTAAQQQAFAADLTLWSDEANIQFTPASTAGTADVEFDVTNSGGTDNQAARLDQYSVVGSKAIPTDVTPTKFAGSVDTITFDNSGPYGTIGSFSDAGGYGVGALTHEIGHMLGLGHSGPYNDGAAGNNPDLQQLNEFDSRQWSVMSYIQPDDNKATYYNSYTVKGTNWGSSVTTSTGNGGTMTTTTEVAPETPMFDDILAAQRLYGAATSGALTQNQTFGFNCTIGDASKSFFDFTQNVNPVITIYDTAANNTLDVSGFSTNCTLNLNPGTFSTASATTLTNNIGIAYGTRIDTAIGGSGDDTFIVNADSDTINGGGGTNTVEFADPRSDYTIVTEPTGTMLVTNNTTGAIDTLTNIQNTTFAPACYCTGTRIATTRGDVAVEALRVGDVAITAAGAHRPIVWLGHRVMDCASDPTPHELWPVRVRAGAFGMGLPERDLFLSPGHPVLVGSGTNEILVPIMTLINGTSIARVPLDSVTYWHIELDAHDILLAEGLPAESFLDLGNRPWFANGADHALTNPDFIVPGLGGRCRPVAIDGPRVEAERRRLDGVFAMGLAAQCAWPGADAFALAF